MKKIYAVIASHLFIIAPLGLALAAPTPPKPTTFVFKCDSTYLMACPEMDEAGDQTNAESCQPIEMDSDCISSAAAETMNIYPPFHPLSEENTPPDFKGVVVIVSKSGGCDELMLPGGEQMATFTPSNGTLKITTRAPASYVNMTTPKSTVCKKGQPCTFKWTDSSCQGVTFVIHRDMTREEEVSEHAVNIQSASNP